MENTIGLSAKDRRYRIFMARGISFPEHIHRTFEVMIVIRGMIETVIDGVPYVMKAGDCAVIFPMQHHRFSVDDRSSVKICLFSTDFIPEFEQDTHGKIPEIPIFTMNVGELCFPSGTDMLEVRAFFYGLCLHMKKEVKTTERPQPADRCSAVEKVMIYVDENYERECDLRSVAKELKYDYTYLSKLFKATTGCTFNEHVNRIRIDRVCYLLNESDMDITSVAIAVGYTSLRTFNREFRKIMGTTPTQYRKNMSA